MKITDMNGFIIEVDDLGKAIAQADNFRKMEHVDAQLKQGDERLKAYWEDIYQKLINLQDDIEK